VSTTAIYVSTTAMYVSSNAIYVSSTAIYVSSAAMCPLPLYMYICVLYRCICAPGRASARISLQKDATSLRRRSRAAPLYVCVGVLCVCVYIASAGVDVPIAPRNACVIEDKSRKILCIIYVYIYTDYSRRNTTSKARKLTAPAVSASPAPAASRASICCGGARLV
jgi:hypothetical protein